VKLSLHGTGLGISSCRPQAYVEILLGIRLRLLP